MPKVKPSKKMASKKGARRGTRVRVEPVGRTSLFRQHGLLKQRPKAELKHIPWNTIEVEELNPRIGRQFIDSVTGRDYPLLLGIVLVFAILISVVNLLVDLSYGLLDPRVRYQ